MENLDGKKIVNNIYAKAKELDVKISDIEKDVPVSPGYFSRFLKDDNHSIPSIESLYVASNKLNVTIDFLILSNFSGMNEEELLMQNKISIMTLKTRNGKYCWKEITGKEFYSPIYPVNGYFHTKYSFHAITETSRHYDAFGENDYVIPTYYSSFLDEYLELDGSVYFLELDSNEFYISKLVDDSQDANEFYYEMYVKVPIDNTYKLYKLVNASTQDKFYSILEELYKTCVLKAQNFKLDVSAKNALDCIK